MKDRLATTLGYAAAILLAATLGYAAYHREPTTYRSTWCMDPDQRASVTVVRANASVQVIARLREVRHQLARLRDDWPDLDRTEIDRRIGDLDGKLFDLIVDVDLSDVIPMEDRP